MLDRATLQRAFEEMGKELGRRQFRGEIAVDGGSAIILQFDFRESTRDTGARILAGHGAVVEAQFAVADRLNLPRGWLDEQVTVYTSGTKDAEGHLPFGSYPSYGAPWLTVLVAKPEYLLAMKLLAARPGADDISDAIALATELRMTTEEQLREVVAAYYPYEKIGEKTLAAFQDVAIEASRRAEDAAPTKRRPK
jgi:hypothetical protein